jgi:iron(III) transport system permease protein
MAALKTALPIMAVSLPLILWMLSLIRQVSLNPAFLSDRNGSFSGWSLWFRFLQKAAIGLLLVQLLVPLIVVLVLVGSASDLVTSIVDGRQETIYSLNLAFWTALAAIPISYLLARVRKNWIAWLILLLPLSFPASFVGIGEIALWNSVFGGLLYGTDWIPWLTNLARFLPLAVLVMSALAGTLDQNLIEMTRLFQQNPLRRLLQIYLPLILPAIFVSFILVFVFSLGELSATMLVLPPGKSTLTLRIFNFLHYGSPQSVAGLSLMLVILAILAAGVAFYFWNQWQKLLPDNGDETG